jgi:excisionase family DNA binding protein
MKKQQDKRLHQRLYSVPEAAAYLGRSVCGVREMIWDGKLPKVQWDRRIYVDKNDLDDLIEKNKGFFIE